MDNYSILFLVIGIIFMIIGSFMIFRVIIGLIRRRFMPFYYMRTPARYINYKIIYEPASSEKGFLPSNWTNALKKGVKMNSRNIEVVKCSSIFFYYTLLKDSLIGLIFLAIGIYIIIKIF